MIRGFIPARQEESIGEHTGTLLGIMNEARMRKIPSLRYLKNEKMIGEGIRGAERRVTEKADFGSLDDRKGRMTGR